MSNHRKTALVTGASRGIGWAITQKLAENGYQVYACSRNEKEIKGNVGKFPDLSPSIVSLSIDMRSPEQIVGLFETIKKETKGIDVLVNNAGLGYEVTFEEYDAKKWREMLEVNILGLSVATGEAVKDLSHRKAQGHIINISSLAGHRVPGLGGMYSATKFAVRALTESLRREVREKELDIRISSISPGFVETNFLYNYLGNEQKARETYSKFKVLDSTDIADAVLYVLNTPGHVEINDILVRPKDQKS